MTKKPVDRSLKHRVMHGSIKVVEKLLEEVRLQVIGTNELPQ